MCVTHLHYINGRSIDSMEQIGEIRNVGKNRKFAENPMGKALRSWVYVHVAGSHHHNRYLQNLFVFVMSDSEIFT